MKSSQRSAKKISKQNQSKNEIKQNTRRKQRRETFFTYIYKVLRQIHPDIGISKKSMEIMNSLLNDVLDRLAIESIQLLKFQNKRTLRSREIHNAVKLVFPGEMARYGISEGTKAVARYLGREEELNRLINQNYKNQQIN